MTGSVRIVGGGMVGLAFAIAIRRALPSVEVSVYEARPLPTGTPNPLDTRASALNLASRDILERWGLWSSLAGDVGVIRRIHVSNQRRFGSSLMQPEDVGADALGYVAENHLIGRAFKACADRVGVDIVAPAEVQSLARDDQRTALTLADGERVLADLVVVADGSDSALRRTLGITVDTRRTGQTALVANVSFEGTQQGCAFERFTAEGPLALLPLSDAQPGQQRFNLVWSMTDEHAEQLRDAGDDEFIDGLQRAFGWRLGAISAVGRRSVWPLERVWAREQVRPGTLVVGNAAHGIHPVAGQGLNLSLRDAATLESVLASSAGGDAGDWHASDTLRRYGALVSADQSRTIEATDLLSTLFKPRHALVDVPRDMALAALDFAPPLRRRIARLGTARDWRPASSHDGGAHR